MTTRGVVFIFPLSTPGGSVHRAVSQARIRDALSILLGFACCFPRRGLPSPMQRGLLGMVVFVGSFLLGPGPLIGFPTVIVAGIGRGINMLSRIGYAIDKTDAAWGNGNG